MAAGIVGGDYTTERGAAVEAVKELVGSKGDARDGVAGALFVADVGRHYAENVGALAGKDEAAIVAHAFKFTGFVGDAEVFRKIPRDIAFFMD
jgi:hypothetical protein